jgi:NadR type nicotinamide-nucleotide adenylyltransferase
MTTALTLGRFAPLHHGHQRLFETALAENDHLVVMIYEAAETDVPLAKRAGWIRQLYPAVEVLECSGGPSEVGYTPELIAAHDAYIVERLGGRKIDAFYSGGERYGEHVSHALGARECRIERHGPGGRDIRADPYAHRAQLDPVVYRDLVTKVLFLGAPSTGKTTLATVSAQHFGTVWMPEYGREYWEQRHVDRRLTPEQLVEIAEGHRQREDAMALEANRCLFVDTDARVTRFFALYYHQSVHPRLEELAREAVSRYDVTIFCEDDIPYDDTWDRSGEGSRALFQQWIEAQLVEDGTPFTRVSGSVEERLRQVVAALEKR